jgi:hypothetical protein
MVELAKIGLLMQEKRLTCDKKAYSGKNRPTMKRPSQAKIGLLRTKEAYSWYITGPLRTK